MQLWLLTTEKKGGEEKREKILLFLRKHVQSKRPVFNIQMSCRSSFALSLSRLHHINGLTGCTWKDFKQTVCDHFYFFLALFLSMVTQLKMRRLLCIICIFSVSRELCLDSHDWINFLQIRAFFKMGPIMWAFHSSFSILLHPLPAPSKVKKTSRNRFWGNIRGLKAFPG